MKQTALQCFWDKIALKLSVEQINEFLPELEQAKEMEKEQITKAYNSAIPFKFGEQYYNETFKKNKCLSCGNDKQNYALYCELCRQEI